MDWLDSTTEPLSWLGKGLSYGLSALDKPGRMVRGGLGGRPRELLNAVPFSDSLGLTDEQDRVTGRDLLADLRLADRAPHAIDPMGIFDPVDFAVSAVTDPLTYVGGHTIGSIADRLAGKAASGPSTFSRLRDLREGFGMVKNVGGEGERMIGRAADRAGQPGLEPATRSLMGAVLGADPATGVARQGIAVRPWNQEARLHGLPTGVGGSLAGAAPETPRHEILHGLTQRAAVTGDSKGLPWIGRLAAREYKKSLKDGGTGFHAGLGNVYDELNSHTFENRTLGKQIGGFTNFLFSPEKHQLYGAQAAEHSPLAAALYHAAPGALTGAPLGAAAGATAYALDGDEGTDPLMGAAIGAAGGAAAGGLLSRALLNHKPMSLGGDTASVLPDDVTEARNTKDLIKGGRQLRSDEKLTADELPLDLLGPENMPPEKRAIWEEMERARQRSGVGEGKGTQKRNFRPRGKGKRSDPEQMPVDFGLPESIFYQEAALFREQMRKVHNPDMTMRDAQAELLKRLKGDTSSMTHEQFRNLASRPDNPVGRMHGLANQAGVGMPTEPAPEDTWQRFLANTFSGYAQGAGAIYEPETRLAEIGQTGIPFGPTLTLTAVPATLYVARTWDAAGDWARIGKPVGCTVGAF